MNSFNLLSSLLSQRGCLDQTLLMKCLQLVIDFFEKSMSNPGQRKELTSFYNEIQGSSQGEPADLGVQAYYSKMFHHCVV